MNKQLLDQLIDYATTTDFSDDISEARREYKERVGEVYEDDQSYEHRMLHFIEWYVFDRNLNGKTITPLFDFIEKNKNQWSETIFQDFFCLTKNIHGLFKIKKISRDHVIVYNFFNGSKYKVMDEQSQLIFRKNDLFEGRIIPGTSGDSFTRAFCFHPHESEKFIKKEINKLMDQLEFHQGQLKKLNKIKNHQERSLLKTNERLKKLIINIEKTTFNFRLKRYKAQIKDFESHKTAIEKGIEKSNNLIKENETSINLDVGISAQVRLMLRLANMSLKWERFRQIDMKDIYTN